MSPVDVDGSLAPSGAALSLKSGGGGGEGDGDDDADIVESGDDDRLDDDDADTVESGEDDRLDAAARLSSSTTATAARRGALESTRIERSTSPEIGSRTRTLSVTFSKLVFVSYK